MDKNEIVENCFKELIGKMKQQIKHPENQSFGSLETHLDKAIKAHNEKEFLNPLYYVQLPRWIGEYGNTELEMEILVIASRINNLVVELAGGKDIVNSKREDNNRRLGY